MTKFWNESMPDDQFELMKSIIGAPSPVSYEAAMTMGVIKPYFEKIKKPEWKIHQFVGNAGIVLDTAPDREDLFTVMVVGHADKIRMHVRSITPDGKIWVNTDAFLTQALVGHEVIIFSRDPKNPGQYKAIEGATVEALSAIHLAPQKYRTGEAGIKKEMVYLELQCHGEHRKEALEELGIAPGDPILMKRPIKRGLSPDTFFGAYLDNGLGCFVSVEVARLIAEHGGLENVRVLCAIATHEEIGRFGSRVLAGLLKPDALISVDVTHDFDASPITQDQRYPSSPMGSGFSITHGAIGSPILNEQIMRVADREGIPYSNLVMGRDFGTDGQAAFLASIDAASASLGFPIRNMHTISETAHTKDVLCSLAAIFETLKEFDKQKIDKDFFKNNHPRFDLAQKVTQL